MKKKIAELLSNYLKILIIIKKLVLNFVKVNYVYFSSSSYTQMKSLLIYKYSCNTAYYEMIMDANTTNKMSMFSNKKKQFIYKL